MRVGDLAAQLGYRSREFLELTKAKGISLGEPSTVLDARLAAAMRSLIPHRSKLSGDLRAVYERVAARAPQARPPAVSPRPAPGGPRGTPAKSAHPPRAAASPPGDPFMAHLRDSSVKLFADTCSLMHERSAAVFSGPVKKSLDATRQRLIVPGAVVRELEKHAGARSSSDDGSRRQRLARQALRILGELPVFHLIEDLRRLDDPFPDALFQNVFVKYRRDFPLSLITQDVALMVDILTHGRSHSIRGIKTISVWEIGAGGLGRVTLESAAARLARRDRRGGPAKS